MEVLSPLPLSTRARGSVTPEKKGRLTLPSCLLVEVVAGAAAVAPSGVASASLVSEEDGGGGRGGGVAGG